MYMYKCTFVNVHVHVHVHVHVLVYMYEEILHVHCSAGRYTDITILLF